jgi:copper resistance protein B
MSTSCILTLATALIAIATGAAAQTPAATDHPAGMPGMQPGGAVQPVQDQEIFAHVLLNENEGRFNDSNTQYRWEGQGSVGTDYDKLWIKSKGTLLSNGTLDDGQHQFLYSRAITTYFDLQGGLRSDIDSRPTRNWGRWAFRVSRLIFSISNSPAMRATRAISPPSSKPPTTSSSHSG